MNSNLINTSVVKSNYYHISQDHHDVDLRNNYAPIQKQLRDSLSTKNVHPLAEYLDERPWYDNVVFTGYNARQLAEARKKYSKPIKIDMVRLNGNDKRFETDIIVGVDPLQPEETKVGKETYKTISEINAEAVEQKKQLTIPKTKQTPKKKPPVKTEEFEVVGEGIKRGGARFISSTPKESFRSKNADDTYTDQVYIQSLESRLIGVLRYIEQNDVYGPWRKNWKALEKSMTKADFSFSRLNKNDNDVAFTVDKGKETKFRIRGSNDRYLPINVYQYVMLHEAAHCANFDNWGHGKEFQDLLSLLCLASFELGFIKVSAINKEVYTTNGQPVLCRGDIKEEILHGIDLIQVSDPKIRSHYDSIREYILKQ